MINNKISGKQFICMIILFLMGSTLVIGVASEARQDSWLAILTGLILALPMAFAYARIVQLFPGKNLYDIVIQLFGKVFGKMIILLYVFYAIHLGSGVLRTISEFIQISNMPETPQIMVLSAFILLCIWMAKSGIETMGRVSKLAFFIVLISITITVVLSIKDMNFNNIKPIMGTDFTAFADSSTTVFSLPLAEIVLLTILYSSVDQKENPYKLFICGLSVAGLLLIVVSLRNLFVLGLPSVLMYYFPSYQAVSVIAIGEFFTRIEVLIGMNLVLAGLIKVCVCLFAASSGLAKLFNLDDHRPMAAPVGVIMVTFAMVMFSNTIEIVNWLKIYKYFALPFQVILPAIILITAEIKTRIQNLILKSDS